MVFDRKNIKSSLKYGSIVLGFIIMTGVFYLTYTEVTQKVNLISISRKNEQIFSDNHQEKITIYNKESSDSAENCTSGEKENKQSNYLLDLIVKSSLAFLAGCILSEKKFFRFGII
jgi:hypothetical protein